MFGAASASPAYQRLREAASPTRPTRRGSHELPVCHLDRVLPEESRQLSADAIREAVDLIKPRPNYFTSVCRLNGSQRLLVMGSQRIRFGLSPRLSKQVPRRR